MQFPIAISNEAIAAFCERWGIVEFSLFGSVLRPDFSPQSDVDVLVVFRKGARPSPEHWEAMEAQLEELFARRVDLVERRGIINPFRRYEILTHRRVLYAA